MFIPGGPVNHDSWVIYDINFNQLKCSRKKMACSGFKRQKGQSLGGKVIMPHQQSTA